MEMTHTTQTLLMVMAQPLIFTARFETRKYEMTLMKLWFFYLGINIYIFRCNSTDQTHLCFLYDYIFIIILFCIIIIIINTYYIGITSEKNFLLFIIIVSFDVIPFTIFTLAVYFSRFQHPSTLNVFREETLNWQTIFLHNFH